MQFDVFLDSLEKDEAEHFAQAAEDTINWSDVTSLSQLVLKSLVNTSSESFYAKILRHMLLLPTDPPVRFFVIIQSQMSWYF